MVEPAGSAPATSHSAASSDREDDSLELSTAVLQGLLGYLRETRGEPVVSALLEEARVQPAAFQRPFGWLSHEQFERVLSEARARLDSDQEFKRACVHKLTESYGPLLVLIRAATPAGVYSLLPRTSNLVSRISRFEVTSLGRTRVQIRYSSSRRESRLMCMSRLVQNQAIPTLWWGLRPAVVTEQSCIAWGDEACVYTLQWHEPVRWRLPIALGGAGAAVATGIWSLSLIPSPLIALLGMAGVALGLLLEARRIAAEQQSAADDTRAALKGMAEQHKLAARELREFWHRQQQWTNSLEAQVAARTASLEMIVGQLRAISAQHQSSLSTITHDIRNPLNLITLTVATLRQELEPPSPELAPILEELARSAHQLDAMFKQLVRSATPLTEQAPGVCEPVQVPALAETLRRRLRALVSGRDIRVSVFQTRDAPQQIVVDSLQLDRVLDNLLSNASKYTDRGSIVLELDGAPGSLCLKISDTGRGISKEKLARVFGGTTPDAAPAVGDSLGLGLSVMTRLLDELGGRLEVMSRPNSGTTFWLRIPIQPPEPAGVRVTAESVDEIVRRVITIREAN